jgi:hypothetical protein
MTNERFDVALRELTRRLAHDGFRHLLRAEARWLKDRTSSADGNVFLEAALADLSRESRRLESGRGEAPR